MFRSRSWFGGVWNKPKNRLSLEHLKYLHNVLERNQTVSETNRGLLVESLRCIAEILIWGDQNDSSVFDFFLEKNMLSYFLHIMRQKSGGSSFVCVQLLQTLNILFENIRNETSLYYLLSNNHVNSIIVHKFDFSDEDVMGYYILFLKTLSLKLNTHTIHFFYNEHTNDFPLYTEAIKFFNHPESMVRIAVRTISLNVYKVENSSMLQFIRDKTAAPYFSNLVWFIGKHILELDSCVRNDSDHQSQNRLSNLVAEHLDHLHYLNDILCLNIADLNAVLTEHLLHKLFVPLYMFSLTPPPPPLSMALVTQNLAAVLNKVVDIDIDIQEINNPRVSCVVALFLLSLVFLVITHGPLVHALAWVILNADHNVFKNGAGEVLNSYISKREAVALGFGQPQESLEEALEISTSMSNYSSSSSTTGGGGGGGSSADGTAINQNTSDPDKDGSWTSDPINNNSSSTESSATVNITDEEKEKLKGENSITTPEIPIRPFLDIVLSSLDCTENDYTALLGLCLFYALVNNKGVNAEWLDQVLNKQSSSSSAIYKSILIEKLLQIINLASQPNCRIRLVTLELSIKLFYQMVAGSASVASGGGSTNVGATSSSSSAAAIAAANNKDPPIIIDDLDAIYQNSIYSSRGQSMTIARNFYKKEDIFLDLFEDEYNEMKKSNLNVEFLCMDSAILLPPTGTPLTGIEFTRRLPCGEVEKARRAIRVFFLLRRLCQTISIEPPENQLPLTNLDSCIKVDDVLNLNNSDLIACTVIQKDGQKLRRFLVIDISQLILVEPETKRLGWGIAKLVGFLQDVEVNGDKDDSRCLHITVHRCGTFTANRVPILSAKFIFDDHIRCMAAKQRLTKGRSKARQKKMIQIAQLLEISGPLNSGNNSSPTSSLSSLYGGGNGGGGGGGGASGGNSTRSSVVGSKILREHRPLFSTTQRVPGFASLRRDSIPTPGYSRVQMLGGVVGNGGGNSSGRSSSATNPTATIGSDGTNQIQEATEVTITQKQSQRKASGGFLREGSPSTSSTSATSSSKNRDKFSSNISRSRDSSPRMPRPRSEEIPMEDFRKSRNSSPVSSNQSSSSTNTPYHVNSHPHHLHHNQHHHHHHHLTPSKLILSTQKLNPTTSDSPKFQNSIIINNTLPGGGNNDDSSGSIGGIGGIVDGVIEEIRAEEEDRFLELEETSKETSFIKEKRKGIVETV